VDCYRGEGRCYDPSGGWDLTLAREYQGLEAYTNHIDCGNDCIDWTSSEDALIASGYTGSETLMGISYDSDGNCLCQFECDCLIDLEDSGMYAGACAGEETVLDARRG